MRSFMIKELLLPLTRKLVTMASMSLVGYGVAQGQADTIGLGITAALGVGIDLAHSIIAKKKGWK